MDGEPPQEEDFSQIPLVERSQHKNWKARLSAYTDIISKSSKTASDTDPFFKPFVTDGPLLKRWCLDANAVAQEKGIDAVLAVVTNSGETSARLRSDIVPALVEKALGNARAGTKKKAIDVCTMFVEIENGGEGVVADVIVGLDSKQPKAVAGAVSCLKEITESFGVQMIGNVKPLLKVLPKIFGHSDKTVRAEGTALTVALYTYLGVALVPSLADLKPVQMADLQKAFDSLDSDGKGAGTGKPSRWTRKIQREREAAEANGGATEEDAEGGMSDEPVAIDPLSLLDPVNAIALFPADLMERLASTKWKDRLEAIEECNQVLAQPRNARISDSNTDSYSSLIQTLGEKCKKDANVNVVIEAAKLLEGLARGLGKTFGKFKSVTVAECMERLKERKANVVDALGKALDAIFLSTSISDITDDILAALKSKNPQVKEGTLNFLHRSLQATRDAPNKDHLKPMAESLVSLLGDSAEPIRTAAAECLGTMMKILGERVFNPYIENVPEIQMAKVKDAFGRAEIQYRPGGGPKGPVARAPQAKAPATRPGPPVKKSAPPPSSPPIKSSGQFAADMLMDEFAPPARAPPARFAKPASAKPTDSTTSSPAPRPTVARPVAAPPKAAAVPSKSVAKAASASSVPSGAKMLASSPTEPVKYRYTPEDAAAKAADVIPADYHTKLADSAWKVRLEAADDMLQWIGEDGGAGQVDSEIMMRFLCKIPGWGEKNFQVSAKLYQVMALMAEKSLSFGKPAASLVIGPLTDKLGDLKLKKPAGDALALFAEKTSLAFVLSQSYEPMAKQKAPKAQADALVWIKQQIIDFGIAGVPLRDLIGFIKVALGSPNALVRSSATQLLVQVKIFVGADISGFLEDLNPQLLSTINSEFDKTSSQTAPEPTRQQADLRDVAAGSGKPAKGGDPLDDLIPRVDLDKLVASTSVINDSKSDAWKVRKEAFENLTAVLEVKSNSRLKPAMGEISSVLKKAMVDTNLSVKMLALGIISKIAIGMGQPFEKYSRVLVAPIAGVCADQKATTRTAALNTLTAVADACTSLDSMYSGLAASLEGLNPALRASVLGWLAERLIVNPPSSTADLSPLAAPVISCLEDRNGDVRKSAGAVLPYVVTCAGFDFVMDLTSRLKPASKATIIPLINNARGAASVTPAAAPAMAKASTSLPPTAPTPAKTVKAPQSRMAAASPRPATAKPSIPAPGRSLAMKALSSAPTTRPGSSNSEDRQSGLPSIKARLPARPPSTFTASSMVATPSLPRTMPFMTATAEAKSVRLKRDANRWSLDVSARNDALEYLHLQMEPHVCPEMLSLFFSKDHKAEEDYMAALAVVAEFYNTETASSFGLPESELIAIQLANVDLALKYAAIRLLSNNTQLANRSLEVVSNVIETLPKYNERLQDTEVKLFVPALVIKLGDAKFGPKLVPIFEGLDKLIPASQVIQLLAQYGLEDKSAGKTCKNESLQLIEKAYRKRGSVLRKDDRAFYEVVAKCIADQGTRQAALNVMALLQLQGESRILQQVIDAMPTASKDMLANRRATIASAKSGSGATAAESQPRTAESIPTSSPARPRVLGALGTPAMSRTAGSSNHLSSSPSSPTTSRPSSRIQAPGSRLPTAGTSTPGRSVASGTSSGIPSGLPRIGTTSVVHKKLSRPPISNDIYNGIGSGTSTRPSMQPLSRAPLAPAVSNVTSDSTMAIEAIYVKDAEVAADALKGLWTNLEDNGDAFASDAVALINALSHQLELTSPRPQDLLEPRNLRRMKHLMHAINAAFDCPAIVGRLKLQSLERLFAGVRMPYALIDTILDGSEVEHDEETIKITNELRDYFSLVLTSIVATPPRELAFALLFGALVTLCKDFTVVPDARLDSEINLVLQCTYKRVRTIDSDLRNNRITPGSLFLVMEDMLQVMPPVQWRRRPKLGLPHGDMPLRVVKTLLQRVIVYTKEIGVGVYDLLSDQFGEDADQTTVYSYIFRISSSSEETGQPTQAAKQERPSSGTSARSSTASGTAINTVDVATAIKSPSRDVTEAQRLVRRLVDPRDNEQGFDELHAFMIASPQNEAEARAAIEQIMTSTAQTFVWRALDRRSEEGAENNSPPRKPTSSIGPSVTLPVRDRTPHFETLPTTSAALATSSSTTAATSRSLSVAQGSNVDDRLAQLKAVFARNTNTGVGLGPSGTNKPSVSAPTRLMGEIGRQEAVTMPASEHDIDEF